LPEALVEVATVSEDPPATASWMWVEPFQKKSSPASPTKEIHASSPTFLMPSSVLSK
jgi:hypothetical protein